ncbi:response regulator [Merdimonas faecis]|uniref:response regulator n=1 Tax=Merdimonas faecis TaxID=1653435 RepID=UPI0023FA2435|nr:response regulator [Merdimonas faecis]
MEDYCKVLIIDDEFIMRQGMKHMLEWEKEGFQIVGEATNGQEGLDLIEKLEPDIVLADIVMPVLDGIEFSQILKQKYPEIQLIILSSYDKFEYVKSTLLNGASDYILKPTLNPEILLKTLQKAARNIPGLTLRKEKELSPRVMLERFLMGYRDRLDEVLFVNTFPHSLYRVAGIDLRALQEGQKPRIVKFSDMAEEYFERQTEYEMLSVLIEEEILCMVFNFRVRDEERVLRDMQGFADKMNSIFDRVFFVIGDSFSGIQGIRKSYQKEIRPNLGMKFYYPGTAMLLSSQVKITAEETRFAFEDYSSALMRRQYGRALEMFREYTFLLCEAKADVYRLKNLTKNLFYNYLIEMEKCQVDIGTMKRAYFSSIDKAENVEKVRSGGPYHEKHGGRRAETYDDNGFRQCALLSDARQLTSTYNTMIRDINQYIEQIVSIEKEKRTAEIHALQMQINPHYMYNTLASIKWLAWQQDTKKTTEVIDAFISLLRNTISNTDEFITVEQEIRNLENYVKINQVRYGDHVKVEYYIPAQCMELRLPKLILQPFVENAFFHGFPEGRTGCIQIFARLEERYLRFDDIEDNGVGMNAETLMLLKQKEKIKGEHFTGIGVNNVDDRIKMIYGMDYGINIVSKEESGTTVTIKIPIRK